VAGSNQRRRAAGRPERSRPPDPERLRRAAREFILALEAIEDADLVEASARRMAEAWGEDILGGYRVEPESLLEPFPAEGRSGMVLVQGIEFTSFCVHHLLPFTGRAHLAYLPGQSLTGISKLARLVDALSRRLQIQEDLTGELVHAIEARLKPRGAAAVVEAEHLCMTARGIKSRGSRVVTAAWSGRFESHPEQRKELLDLLDLPPTE
jgi:GTP cyclohydrolase I